MLALRVLNKSLFIVDGTKSVNPKIITDKIDSLVAEFLLNNIESITDVVENLCFSGKPSWTQIGIVGDKPEDGVSYNFGYFTYYNKHIGQIDFLLEEMSHELIDQLYSSLKSDRLISKSLSDLGLQTERLY